MVAVPLAKISWFGPPGGGPQTINVLVTKICDENIKELQIPHAQSQYLYCQIQPRMNIEHKQAI